MFRRLRELLVQDVPAELSVCEFDCPVTRCTTDRWASCTLRQQDRPDNNAAEWIAPVRRELRRQRG